MSNLTPQEIDYLKNHFKTWLVTDTCKIAFDHILERITSMRILETEEKIYLDWKKGTIFLKIQGDGYDNEPVEVYALFGPRRENRKGRLNAITSLHEDLLLYKPEDDMARLNFPSFMYDHFKEDEEEEDIERFNSFCDIAQDCVVGDTENLNAFNEPKLCLFSHGGGLDDSDVYPGQDQDGYNYGGFVLRALASLTYTYEDSEKHKLYYKFSCS